MKKLFVVAASCGLLFCQSAAMAQNANKCGHQAVMDAMQAKDPQFAERMQQYRENTKVEAAEFAKMSAAAKTTATPVIPIVFHILLNQAQLTQIGGVPGVEARVVNQVAQLNKDFNRGNPDSTAIPAGFKSLYGSVNIQFSLAHRKPNGASTAGYEIVTLPASKNGFSGISSGYSVAKHATTDGADAWDATKYFNVWVINPTDMSTLLGVTSPPSFSFPTQELGIVLNYGAFGVRTGIGAGQYYISGSDAGRTLTHEMGHYFEIWHVWGDDGGACPGSGGNDDGIADTPPQAKETYPNDNPAYPEFDACTGSGNGIMFMNFMDYMNDNAMHMFTKGQIAVMNSKVNGQSLSLTQHPELTQWPTDVAEVTSARSFNIAPNPAVSNITISFNSGSENLKSVSIFNMMGQEVKTLSLQGQNGVLSVNVSDLGKGMYFVKCRFDDETISQKLLVQ